MTATAHQIKAIHAEARRIGMDEDTRRLFMQREVGKQSTKDMSEQEAQKVILVMKRQNAATKSNRKRNEMVSGKYAGILRAMWLNAYHLGVVKNKDDRALLEFSKRQTGADHTQFLTNAKDAGKVVDALKAMMAREAHIDWSVNAKGNPQLRTELMQRRVLDAQTRILGMSETPKTRAEKLNDEIARLGVLVRKKRDNKNG